MAAGKGKGRTAVHSCFQGCASRECSWFCVLACVQEGQVVATGEAGARPKVLVWDAMGMTVLATLK